MLRKTCEDLVEIHAEDFVKDSSTGKLILKNKPITKPGTSSLSSNLLLGINARVMLTRNCNVDDGLVNGVMGHVSHFVYGQKHATKTIIAVGVVFDNNSVGKKSGKRTQNGNTVLIERVQEDILEQKTRNVVRHQFPIRLSLACTAHKVQGMTVDRVVVDLDRTFCPGQGYVALSRVTSKAGLFIETKGPELLPKKLYADPDVKKALMEMPKLNLPNYEIVKEGITIFLLNIQSLNKHFEDLKHDIRCKKADIICLTETWLKSGQSVGPFEINGFNFHHATRRDAYDDSDAQVSNLHSSKGGGVAVYINDTRPQKNVILLPEYNLEGICVKCISEDIIVVTVYRPNILCVSQFLLQLEKVLDFCKSQCKFSVCLGDFNEDARSVGPIQTFMTNKGFNQIVHCKTTEGATTLDHVYLSAPLQSTVEHLPTYYSYHDALLVNIRRKT